jgi:regulator of replication initiation timing
MATATRSVEIDPIDRLEDKLKRLVGVVERMKADLAQSTAENQRLASEMEGLRARLAAGDSVASEVSMLRKERDAIRGRVEEMLEQLEALNL